MSLKGYLEHDSTRAQFFSALKWTIIFIKPSTCYDSTFSVSLLNEIFLFFAFECTLSLTPFKNETVKNPRRKFQKLAIEIYKVKNDITPKLICDIRLQKTMTFEINLFQEGKKTTEYLIVSAKNIQTCPRSNSETPLTCIKKRIKLKTTDKCPSQICKKDLEQAGFI